MIFILDNFDSFAYNLFQYLGEIGEQVVVKRRDQCTLEEIAAIRPELIILSPGPCTPDDAPLVMEVIREFQDKIPIFGVCLGHQAIGQVFGGKVIRAIRPVHGKTERITHDGQGAFWHLPNPLEVTRYHSLVVERSSLPEDFIITAETKEGEIMGLRHRAFPIEGVQFHPEALMTAFGHELLYNAVRQAREWNQRHQSGIWRVKEITLPHKPCQMFHSLRTCPGPFFLDSGENYPGIGGYSFLGAYPFLEATGYLDRVELYWPEQKRSETIRTIRGSLQVLDELCARYRMPQASPFPFAGGAVGFFSYDLKDELEILPDLAQDDLRLPLWRFAWYDGVLVYDHWKERYFLTVCGINEDGICRRELAEKRLTRLEEILGTAGSNENRNEVPLSEKSADAVSAIRSSLDRPQYLQDLQRLIAYVYEGDIYQANLTQRFTKSWEGDCWRLFEKLHEQNPAPFAAFLPYADFQILSSSPERFVQIDARLDTPQAIATYPIKGTRPRGKSEAEDKLLALELQNSSKDRAELTMIIDLERNDLGRICRFGSVRVPDRIRLEKHPTVWHLVSTITGELRPELRPSEILKAIFPGGSITGAPKIRAMEIIEELEPYKRGIYTGSIGYLGYDGAWDLNIAIRTLIIKDGVIYLNTGGGIVADSVPEAEYQETLDKAAALFKAIGGALVNESQTKMPDSND